MRMKIVRLAAAGLALRALALLSLVHTQSLVAQDLSPKTPVALRSNGQSYRGPNMGIDAHWQQGNFYPSALLGYTWERQKLATVSNRLEVSCLFSQNESPLPFSVLRTRTQGLSATASAVTYTPSTQTAKHRVGLGIGFGAFAGILSTAYNNAGQGFEKDARGSTVGFSVLPGLYFDSALKDNRRLNICLRYEAAGFTRERIDGSSSGLLFFPKDGRLGSLVLTAQYLMLKKW